MGGLGFAAFLFERVIFALAAGLRLAPTRFDPALAFQAMQDRVKHAIGPLQLLMGMSFDLLDDGVTVGFALGEEGEDERFGGGGDEFLTNHRGNMHRVYMYVKPGVWSGANLTQNA